MGILLTVAYDGTNYNGWQSQPGSDTIQERLEHGLSAVYQKKVSVLGASRTDAGVHAVGQRVHFHIEQAKNAKGKNISVPLDKLPFVLNGYLPPDIIVTSAEQTNNEFHPIKSAKRKTYEYTILNRRYPDPKLRNYTCHIKTPLYYEAMQKSCSAFVGTHDFSAFRATGGNAKTDVRTVFSCSMAKDGDKLTLIITGDGFLYNMVRIIAGTLISVGKGKIGADCIPRIIESKDRTRSGQTAPACGLTLFSVDYAL